MRQVLLQPDFEAWREAAREALHSGYAPQDLDLQDATASASLALSLDTGEAPTGTSFPRPHTSQAFLETAVFAAANRNPDRWNLLYRILYRLQTDRVLLSQESDPDVAELLRLSAQVQREIHQMQVFVQFRKVLRAGELVLSDHRPVVLDETLPPPSPNQPEPHHLVLATPTPFGTNKTELEQCLPAEPPPNQPPAPDEDCEYFIAWYQPEHRILPLAAPFFAKRFAILRWTILTPDAIISWNPVSKTLTSAPGIPRETAPSEEELEDLWRTHYAEIATPIPLNPVPKPKPRVLPMAPRTQPKQSAEPFVPPHPTLRSIQEALPTCRGCDLYRHATQVVPGRGPAHAPLLIVGEQPGDQEDLQGLPFVGPAGKLLDRTLAELDIDRSLLFVTNAVKHFKFVQRGKLRIHQNPRLSELTACRPWLQAEIATLKPRVVLCLGASASKSLLGGSFGLMRDRGKVHSTPFADKVIATFHPSAILRAPDEKARHQMLEHFKTDLAHAAHLALKPAATAV
ncbi:UdgX family uracil-DNA binding protein [Granulicella sp. dw_53]|uniref:UdgX family uracil-DNA binding protein n=1 Tax=Granulicella sp. dw_53 TaxID=2719792 RepID=UPI001BD3FCCA|nr:UdgX family uracil-DNA binding protein [Granulicella sp. dw_53]